MNEHEMSDEFADYDGAYVLGALSKADREAFEVHLIECADCRARVAELSELPPLLALAPASAYAQRSAPVDPVIPLLAAARARRRRRTSIMLAAATAAAACLVAGTAYISHNSGHARPTAIGLVTLSSAPSSTAAPAGAAMTVLAAAPIHATIEVTDVAWGTSIKLHCTYDDAGSTGGYAPDDEQYSLAVLNREGQTDNLGTWAVVPGKVTTFPAGTAFHKSDIASITVSTANGTPLLQLRY